MNPLDYILIIVLAVLTAWAIYSTIKGKGSCKWCNGNCGGCARCSKCNIKKNDQQKSVEQPT